MRSRILLSIMPLLAGLPDTAPLIWEFHDASDMKVYIEQGDHTSVGALMLEKINGRFRMASTMKMRYVIISDFHMNDLTTDDILKTSNEIINILRDQYQNFTAKRIDSFHIVPVDTGGYDITIISLAHIQVYDPFVMWGP